MLNQLKHLWLPFRIIHSIKTLQKALTPLFKVTIKHTIWWDFTLTELWTPLSEQRNKYKNGELCYPEIIMMHGEFCWVPDDGGDGVTLLQCLVDQKLSGLSRSSQHGDLHCQILAHWAQSVLVYRPHGALSAYTDCWQVPSLLCMIKCKKLIVMVQ